MKKIIFLTLAYIFLVISVNAQNSKKALLIIDIQDFYFPGGSSALVEPEKAASNAALILGKFRKENLPVIYVRHNSGTGGSINKLVSPLPGEKIFSKDEINCFTGTGLNDFLKSSGIDTLVICGMQTHLCVEAATRAASDMGYKCILIHDASATKDLKFGDKIIKAEDVHLSTLNTLKNYSTVLSTAEYLNRK